MKTKVAVVTERTVVETKEGEVIYSLSPHRIMRLEIVLSDCGKPIPAVPSPSPYAVDPTWDYYLVRVPREKKS